MCVCVCVCVCVCERERERERESTGAGAGNRKLAYLKIIIPSYKMTYFLIHLFVFKCSKIPNCNPNKKQCKNGFIITKSITGLLFT